VDALLPELAGPEETPLEVFAAAAVARLPSAAGETATSASTQADPWETLARWGRDGR
jgi:hypothetical protein